MELSAGTIHQPCFAIPLRLAQRFRAFGLIFPPAPDYLLSVASGDDDAGALAPSAAIVESSRLRANPTSACQPRSHSPVPDRLRVYGPHGASSTRRSLQ